MNIQQQDVEPACLSKKQGIEWDCVNNWPPPLPSLPVPPPCPGQKRPEKRKKIPAILTPQYWDSHLSHEYSTFKQKLSTSEGRQRSEKRIYDLTSKQRRELMPIKHPNKQDKCIWSVPLPDGSYPDNGLPIWQRLYLDRKLPMLECPPNALVFARQKIGNKLWKDTPGQEFILYDPMGYEVPFPYENIHDPNLTAYYERAAIRGFLLSLGDANEEGWGISSLKRFNEYRKYLKRVHLSMVHSAMARQEAMEDEYHSVNLYKQRTNDTLDYIEKKCTMDEAGAALREAMRIFRMNRINRIIAGLKEKEERIRKINIRKAEIREEIRQRGLILKEQQELKKKIATEIARRKKIATLRKWHDNEESRMRFLKKMDDEKRRFRAEKVRSRWQNKIDSMCQMLKQQDERIMLQTTIKQVNIAARDVYTEVLKKREKDTLAELKQRGLKKKASAKRKTMDRKMEAAITDAWLNVIETDYDLGTEIYRIKKSINSTMAELHAEKQEGPERYSIVVLARHRIQREQTIPLQVSYAIDVLLEHAIEGWAEKRIEALLMAVVREAMKHGNKKLAEVKARNKDLGIPVCRPFKSSQPKGIIYKSDTDEDEEVVEQKGEDSSDTEIRPGEEEHKSPSDKFIQECVEAKMKKREEAKNQDAMMITYVHMGTFTHYDSPYEPLPPENLKPVRDRPKTPMPSQVAIAQAGFEEEDLRLVMPTLSRNVEMKQKLDFNPVFLTVARELLKRAKDITQTACEPRSRMRLINKIVFLGDSERETVIKTLCYLIMNKGEKEILETPEFDWIARVIAREAINGVLKPVEFQRISDDSVSRTKTMFYKPRPRRKFR